MPTALKDMIAAANAAVPRLSPEEVQAHLAQGDVLLLDVRDPTEVAASGKLRGAVTVSRGMLEFRADPGSPAHLPPFRPERTVLVYCGSGARSALSGRTLQELGYSSVFNAGAYKDLAAAGLDTEPA